MPSVELFKAQNQAYREKILPSDVRNRVSIEMASTFGWGEFTGLDGLNIGIDRFGISGPGGDVAKKLGFTTEDVVEKIKQKFY